MSNEKEEKKAELFNRYMEFLNRQNMESPPTPAKQFKTMNELAEFLYNLHFESYKQGFEDAVKVDFNNN